MAEREEHKPSMSHWYQAFNFGDKAGTCAEMKDQLLAGVEEYRTTMNDWYNAFEPLFDTSRSEPRSKAYLGANVLKARWLPSRFLFLQTEEGIKAPSEAFLPEYTELVDLLQEVLENDPHSRPGEACFTFDTSSVLVLFLVALRCRHCIVRRKAISLLVRHPRREGLWDSLMCAKVSTWVMNMEEAGMEDGKIPESARLRIEKDEFVLSERKATVRCSKLDPRTGQRVLLPEVTLSW